jgi:C-terminal processing protease CtpA/Prc
MKNPILFLISSFRCNKKKQQIKFQLLKYFNLVILCFNGINCFSQNTDIDNLSFEIINNNKFANWHIDSGFVAVDSIEKKDGKYSLKIDNQKLNSNQIIKLSNTININQKIDSITLSGFYKCEKLEGEAFIAIVNSNENEEFAFDISNSINDNNEWNKFILKIPIHKKSNQNKILININGNTKIWFDNFTLSVVNSESTENLPELNWINLDYTNKKSTNEKIEIIIKLWGFLKYHNNEVFSENNRLNWDNYLFELLKLLNSNNFEIDLEKEIIKNKQNDILFQPDKTYKWFHNKYISSNLKDYLIKTLNSSINSDSKYVKQISDIKINSFVEENYSDLDINITSLKLLSLSRLWNIVEYYYPYKDLMDQDWDMTLKEFIPKILKSKSELDYLLALNDLLSKMNDNHSKILFNSKLEEYYGQNKLGLKVKIIENKLIVVDIPYNQKLLKKGDEIILVESKLIKKEIKKSHSLSASNESSYKRELASLLIRTNSDSVLLKVKRDKEILNFKVPTFHKDMYSEYKKPQENLQELNNDIGYIFPEKIKANQIDSIFTQWNHKKAIIIDLRCYPNLNLTKYMTPFLFENEYELFSVKNCLPNQPGKFMFEKNMIFTNFKKPVFKGDLIIIVDEHTHSKAEFNAMTLSEYPNAKVIGGQTSGTDGDTQKVVLPCNIVVNMTCQGIFTKNKIQTQRTGLYVSTLVKENIDSIKLDNDTFINVAIKEILQD